MFTFGILSSHIPYVAFVAFYLFYLIFPSQFEQHDSIKTGDEKILFVESIAPAEQVLQAAGFYFQVEAETQETQIDFSPECQTMERIPIRNDRPIPGIPFYSPLFSRPPPVL